MLPKAANPSTGNEIRIPSPPRTNRATVRIRADFPPSGLIMRLTMNSPTEARNPPLDRFILITVANIEESARTCVEPNRISIRWRSTQHWRKSPQVTPPKPGSHC